MYKYNSQAEIKETAKNLKTLLNSSPKANQSSIIRSIISDQNNADEMIFALNVARELSNQETSKVSLGYIQQMLAKHCENKSYQILKKGLYKNHLDARRFLGLKFSVGTVAYLDSETLHPFPLEYEKIACLKLWKIIWEKYNVSTKAMPFMAPAIPLSCFEGTDLHAIQYQDWHKYRKECKSDGIAGVIIYCKEKVVGTMRWYWWGGGNTFKASDFRFYIKNGNKLISSCIDLRPDHGLPTFGPDVQVAEGTDDLIQEILNNKAENIKLIRFPQD